MNTMMNREFAYSIHGFDLRLRFVAEDRVQWTNLSKPETDPGRSSVEVIDRRDIADGIVLMAWTEKSGVHVVDIIDLNTMTLHSNLVLPDGKRAFAMTTISETGSQDA